MSELMNTRSKNSQARWRLMAGVSATALLIAVNGGGAQAEDADRPTVWIELGGQLERVDGGLERFTPSFFDQAGPGALALPIAVQRPPRYANGLEGKLSFQPEDSEWVISAAVRYGRSNNKRKGHQESPIQQVYSYISMPGLGKYGTTAQPAAAADYSNTVSRHDESHLLVDFQAGKDVGLGLFGRNSSSVLSVGVRFAQFGSKSTTTIGAIPDFSVSYKYLSALPSPFPPIPGNFKFPQQDWHQYHSVLDIVRSFHGLGPTISWDASAPVFGNVEIAELSFDWGVNAAVLFGRQKAIGSHDTDALKQHSQLAQTRPAPLGPYHYSRNINRSRSVVVPNVGGFAGVSLSFPNAKISFGYRADFFFGAMDGGIDTRKTYDRNFYGPFATISIGLGG